MTDIAVFDILLPLSDLDLYSRPQGRMKATTSESVISHNSHSIWMQCDTLFRFADLKKKKKKKKLISILSNQHEILRSLLGWFHIKQPNKQNNKKSKRSNDPHSLLKRLLHSHLPYMVKTIMNISVASCNFSTKWLHKFYLSSDPVTLSEQQSHSNWNQTIEFSHV